MTTFQRTTAPTANPHPALALYGVEPPPPERTLAEIAQQTIDSFPDALAMEAGSQSLTYAELESVIDHHVQRLWELGIGRGDRVGIRVPSGTLDIYVSILATIFAGAAYVPVDWDDPDSRATTVWEEASVAAVFGKDLEITRFDEIPVSNDRSRPGLEDDAWIIFTSGSTGKPKGVAITHRSAGALVDAEAEMFLAGASLAPGDRIMGGLSIAFDASCEEMWLAWRSGATLVSAERDIVRSGPDLGDWIISKGITAISTVPTLASLWPAEALEQVRLLIFGGEACPHELAVRLLREGCEVWNTYGPTEATVIASAAQLTHEPPVRIGLPLPGWELAVVNEDEEPVEWGETGELIIGGVGLGRYLDIEMDAEKYAPMPTLGWERAYRTGDMVKAEEPGLVFAGRVDDQIKLGGRRLELGEIDALLTRMPNVSAGAAVLQKTPAGADILVGYLLAEKNSTLDLDAIRRASAAELPGGVMPILYEVAEMPMKTSGKVDRPALPWPLPKDPSAAETDIDPSLEWLAHLWMDQLGPVPLEEHSNFFDLGGGSVAVARLVADLRKTYPSAEIGQIYTYPTLQTMQNYLDTLTHSDVTKPDRKKIPAWTGAVQSAVVVALYVLNGLRYVIGSVTVVWVLAIFFGAGWVVAPPIIPVIIFWLLFFSLPGRVLMTAAIVRLLNVGIRPGRYARGGWVHLRIWTADRIVIHQRLENILGTPLAPRLHRLFGNKVGERTHLHHMPSVTGLVVVGDDVSVEAEVDLHGHWIDGDELIVDTITIDDGARVGARSFLSPGAHIGAGAEVIAGSHVPDRVPPGQAWGGSPLYFQGAAGISWPAEAPEETPGVRIWSRQFSWLAYVFGLSLIEVLPLFAVGPGGILLLSLVIDMQQFAQVFVVLFLWSPVFVVATMITWLFLVIAVIRLLSAIIPPGYFPNNSRIGWAVWLTHTLLQRTLISTYIVYASALTPTFMRLLGMKVGKGTEISTLETIPHLTWLHDNTFIADHALLNSARHYQGWLHVGTTVIGEGAFVGNSAIVGPDRDLPGGTLVGVLSSTPYRIPRGSSWLGRKAKSIPRVKVESDAARTFAPPKRLKVARVCVEALRLVPMVFAAWLDLAIVFALTNIYMAAGDPLSGIISAALWSAPVVLAGGIIASLIPCIIKWVATGAFRAGEKPLFSTFVWRSELADAFSESLAVPSLIRMSLGSPMFNLWARLMGTKIGRNVWCESWWLPEFDLITLADGVTINRGTVLQTHLFHDRVMGLESVVMEAGSTLGPNSFILPGALVGERTTIGPGSLVLRQEQIPSDGFWIGNPVQHVAAEEAA